MLLLFNNLLEKSITESQDGLNLDSGKLLFVTCTHVTTLHLYYMKNAPVVSQSEVCNFFMSIFTSGRRSGRKCHSGCTYEPI